MPRDDQSAELLTDATRAKRPRLTDIDRAKGLAIALVVLGHVVAREPPVTHAHWVVPAKEWIYSFHMPFFMFLSGFVMFLTYKPVQNARDYGKYVWNRFWRLMPAYILFAFLVFGAKLYAQRTGLHVDNPVTAEDALNIFIRPLETGSQFLWYIYVLFLYYATVPLLARIVNYRIIILLPFAFALYFVPASTRGSGVETAGVSLFAINRFLEYLSFFLLGAYVSTRYQEYVRLLDKVRWIVIALFVAASCIYLYLEIALAIEHPIPKVVMGLISIPALHALVRTAAASRMGFLAFLGGYTFSIYLMNTLAIGGTKAVLLKALGTWEGANFYIFLPALLLAGIYIPVLIKVYVFKRIPPLDKITA